MKPQDNHFPNARILVVDDHLENVKLVARFLEWAGYMDVQVMTNSEEALAFMKVNPPDILLLDLHMPKPDGYEILSELRKDIVAYRFVPILVFTADTTAETKARALDAGASDFLTKPGDVQEILLRVRNFLALRQMQLKIEHTNKELEESIRVRTASLMTARREALTALARAAELRDDETGLHTQRVGLLSERIARELGAQEDFADSIRLAAPLHDVGKVALPDAILLKAGPLDDAEIASMRLHTTVGAGIFDGCESPLMKLSREIALCHHERWDGSGYPHGLKGEQIPLAARIVAIADVYDALTHERPYKPAYSHDEAVSRISVERGRHFDPKVVDAFLDVVGAELGQRAA